MPDPLPLRPSDRQLIAALRQHGDLSRGQLARLSGLPRSTITDAVLRLQRMVGNAGVGALVEPEEQQR